MARLVRIVFGTELGVNGYGNTLLRACIAWIIPPGGVCFFDNC